MNLIKKIYLLMASCTLIIGGAVSLALLNEAPAKVSASGTDYALVGDFPSSWNTTAYPMTDNGDGTYSYTMDIAGNKSWRIVHYNTWTTIANYHSIWTMMYGLNNAYGIVSYEGTDYNFRFFKGGNFTINLIPNTDDSAQSKVSMVANSFTQDDITLAGSSSEYFTSSWSTNVPANKFTRINDRFSYFYNASTEMPIGCEFKLFYYNAWAPEAGYSSLDASRSASCFNGFSDSGGNIKCDVAGKFVFAYDYFTGKILVCERIVDDANWYASIQYYDEDGTTLIDDNQIALFDTDFYPEPFESFVIKEDEVFAGWYFDNAYSSLYAPMRLDSTATSIDMYAKFIARGALDFYMHDDWSDWNGINVYGFTESGTETFGTYPGVSMSCLWGTDDYSYHISSASEVPDYVVFSAGDNSANHTNVVMFAAENRFTNGSHTYWAVWSADDRAEAYSTHFLSATSEECSASAVSQSTWESLGKLTIVGEVKNYSGDVSLIGEDAIAVLNTSSADSSGTETQQAVARYDLINSKYGYGNFLERFSATYYGSPFVPGVFTNEETITMSITLAILVAILDASFIFTVVVFHKRRDARR